MEKILLSIIDYITLLCKSISGSVGLALLTSGLMSFFYAFKEKDLVMLTIVISVLYFITTILFFMSKKARY